MNTFHELFSQQSSLRIMELIAAHDETELRRLRSWPFLNSLIDAARSAPIPEGPWMPYREVWKRQCVAGGRNDSEKIMVARAMLIAKHCRQEGVQCMLKVYRDTDWETRIEIWLRTVPIGVRMMPYRKGLYRQQIQIFCEEMGVPYEVVVPFCDRLDLCERYNPANSFPLTPDCEQTFQKMVKLAN